MFQTNKLGVLSLLVYLIPISFIFGILITEILVLSICILFLHICFVNKITIYFKTFYFKFLILIYFFLIANSIFSGDLFLSIKVSIPYIRYIILSLAIWFLIEKNKNFIKEFSYFFLPVLAFLVFDGFIQYFIGSNIIGFSTQSSRLSSFFFDEWILGSFIQKFFPLLIFVLFYNLERKQYLNLKLISLILAYLIVFLSGERAAFFLLSFYIILILPPLFLINKKINKLIYLLIPIVFIVFILSPVKERVFLLNSNADFKTSAIKFYNSNYSLYLKTSINIFLDNKIIGSGVKTYRVKCKDYYDVDVTKSCSTHPHNYYLQVLAECGLIGLLTLISILLYLISSYIRLISKGKNYIKENFNKIILLSGLLVFIWPFATTGSFFNNFISIILFFNLGFFLGNSNSKKV